MEEIVAILIGAGIVALLPLVPALRPAVKSVVKGGLVVAGAAKGATEPVGKEWRDIVNEAKTEAHAASEKAEDQASAAVKPEAKPARRRRLAAKQA